MCLQHGEKNSALYHLNLLERRERNSHRGHCPMYNENREFLDSLQSNQEQQYHHNIVNTRPQLHEDEDNAMEVSVDDDLQDIKQTDIASRDMVQQKIDNKSKCKVCLKDGNAMEVNVQCV